MAKSLEDLGFTPENEDNLDESNLDQFLHAVSGPESSYGKNIKHKQIESGPNKGQTAIGRYGLLPETVKEFIGRGGDKNLNYLKSMEWDDIKKELESNPDLEQQVARIGAKHVLTKYSEPELAAMAWRKGHNMSKERIKKIANEPDPENYINKFKKGFDSKSRKLAAPSINDLGFIPENKLDDSIQALNEKYSEKEPEFSTLQSLGLGGLQGASFGFADEIEAAFRAGAISGEDYERLRDEARARYKRAQEENPKAFFGGNVAGGIATSLIPGLNIAKGATIGGAAVKGALLGGTAGLGASEASDLGGLATDVGVGMTLGGATGALGQKIAKSLSSKELSKSAAKSAAKALGDKKVTQEGLDIGETVLKEKVLPVRGGAQGILDAINKRSTELEDVVVQPTLKKVSENVNKNTILQKSLESGKFKEPIQMAEDSVSLVMKQLDENLPQEILKKIEKTAINEVSPWINKITETGGDPARLNNLRKSLDSYIKDINSRAFKIEDASPKIEVLKNLRKELNANIRALSNEISSEAGTNLKEAMTRQSKLYKAAELVEPLIEKDIKNPPGSILKALNPTTPTNIATAILTKLSAPVGAAVAVGKGAKLVAEKSTQQPIGRLANILSARSKYALSKSPTATKALQAAARGTGTAVRTEGVQSGLQSLYSGTPESKKEIATVLMNDPATAAVGTKMNEALENNDSNLLAKTEFLAMQNPTIRAKLMEYEQGKLNTPEDEELLPFKMSTFDED